MDIGKRYDRVKVRYLPVWLSVCAILVILFAVDSSHLGVARTIDRYEKMRRKMIQAIEDDVRETSQRIGKKQLDPRVMEVIGTVPRHEFVPLNRSMFAYENRPLPIGFGQTISQPYIVALMTDLLNVKSDAVILEIGTGSGYQAAILSALVKAVYTIEIIKPLGNTARTRLEKLGYTNVHRAKINPDRWEWAEAHEIR